ncbi:hypothetical protein TPHA_0D02400 [Tetrapisispora phaffii CBS 4417]|uniref:RRM domain-containing protein n=1 Tax=Tetrapisispora phaffii (strain ATCC 24235 / CBS 4417 / NBRC 1672 / NRRL Y-8282 / UCD 70-5) TaxID=1071381 RepID=G8BSQ6_TETPH|nr:hypothetical protein TPHA_0D02400 [Tetrapisispora phaffii CBS 4417]CCE62877.1 hypothetical protein TPHA_0D02400 [Tetrapisispora phaffii CBS 4417]
MIIPRTVHEVVENPDETVSYITYKETTVNGNTEKSKLTQKIRNIFALQYINSSVLARKKWKKYGSETNSPPGPNHSTTQLGEEVYLLLGTNWRELEEEQTKIERKKKQDKLVSCRYCAGPHFSIHCPNKAESRNVSNKSLNNTTASSSKSVSDVSSDDVRSSPSKKPLKVSDTNSVASSKTNPTINLETNNLESSDEGINNDKYSEQEEETFIIKISQLNTHATEEMIRDELLYAYDNIQRVAVIRNRETGKSRGFAFITFTDEKSAEDALYGLDGKGFMNLILRVEWSVPRD